MDNVLVRYSSIGTKSRVVQTKMRRILRQRVEDRLDYEGIEYEKVFAISGRVIAVTPEAGIAADAISELPGVASVSPSIKTGASIEEMKEAAERFEYGETFGVDANRAGDHEFSSPDIKRELGSHIEEFSGAGVDLDNPGTLLEVDVRGDEAYVFSERIQGPGGLPVGSQESFAALISGGIDSPVAAYQMMVRGVDIIPVYFYNKPVAAEDHLLRFQAAVNKLERFNPAKKWYYYRVDMEEVNEELRQVEKGRMVLHRIIMFRVAERIAEEDGLKGLVTGESLGQKSSQTSTNLEIASREVDLPIYRPLIGLNKNDIVDRAKEIGTFEDSTIDSACSTMAPDSPSTALKPHQLEDLKHKVDLEDLVDTAYRSRKKITL